MVRNIFGSILALAGAAAAAFGPFQAWYNGRKGRDYPLADLFQGISGNGASGSGAVPGTGSGAGTGAAVGGGGLFTSLVLPFAFAAVLTLIALVLRSRPLMAVTGLIVLGFTILWMVRQGQAAGSLTINRDGSGLGIGVAYTFGGGVLLLLAALVMRGRRRRDRYLPADDFASGTSLPPDGPDPQQDWGQRYGSQGHPPVNYGPEDYGRQSYGRQDYGPEDYGQQDYGQQDYGQQGYGQQDDMGRDYGVPEYEQQYGADRYASPRRYGRAVDQYSDPYSDPYADGPDRSGASQDDWPANSNADTQTLAITDPWDNRRAPRDDNDDDDANGNNGEGKARRSFGRSKRRR
jgi:hypothetical protein